MSWVCPDRDCRSHYDTPSEVMFRAQANVWANEEIDEITEVRCSDCSELAYYCDMCQSSWCSDHHPHISTGELYDSSFSTNVEWVTQKKETAV